MTQYAHYVDSTHITYPTASEFPGIPNWIHHDPALRLKGYVPVSNMPGQQEGKLLVLDTFAFHESSTTRIEPREVSPGKWEDVTITVDTSTITVETYHYNDKPEPAHTVSEYDAAMEAYLTEVQYARGYTKRDPALYTDSTNARWKQDAVDWIDFRDRVMTYGLEVENQYEETGEPPCTLDEFKTQLRTIEVHWTYEATQE